MKKNIIIEWENSIIIEFLGDTFFSNNLFC